MVIELSIQKFNPKVLVVSHAIMWGRVAHTSIMLMCDTTRQHATQHDRGPRHDDFLLWCHTYHDMTMQLDSDSLQTLLQFCGVQLITRLFTRGYCFYR